MGTFQSSRFEILCEGGRGIGRRGSKLSRVHGDCSSGSRAERGLDVSTLSVEGGCLCGAIRYRVEGTPSSISICHCRSCRLASGAPTVSWFVVSRTQFKLLSGGLTTHQSSKPVHRGFCGKCGTQLTYEHDSTANTIELTTASLDEPQRMPPTKEIWLSEKLPWAVVNENLSRHFEDSQATESLPQTQRSNFQPAGWRTR